MRIRICAPTIDKPELKNLCNKSSGFTFTELKSVAVNFMDIYLVNDLLLKDRVATEFSSDYYFKTFSRRN